MKNRKNLFIALGAGIAAGAAAFAYFKKNRKTSEGDEYLLTGDAEDELFFDFSAETQIDSNEAEKKALEAARERLGSSAVIASASDNRALTVNIGGTRRHCFMFGATADSLSVNPETLLFYVDAISGEVFESND